MHKPALFLFVAAAALSWTAAASSAECPIEKAGPSLSIPNSDWIVEQTIQACGFGVAGPLVLSALNTKTRERVNIAAVDDYSHTTVSTDENGDLLVTTPNLALLSDEVRDFGGVKVVYNYLDDDPRDRTMWRRYIRNREDQEAKRWVCTNIANKRNEFSREIWRKTIGCADQ